jgi:DNA-binding transcriptional ArsR family regulator
MLEKLMAEDTRGGIYERLVLLALHRSGGVIEPAEGAVSRAIREMLGLSNDQRHVSALGSTITKLDGMGLVDARRSRDNFNTIIRLERCVTLTDSEVGHLEQKYESMLATIAEARTYVIGTPEPGPPRTPKVQVRSYLEIYEALQAADRRVGQLEAENYELRVIAEAVAGMDRSTINRARKLVDKWYPREETAPSPELRPADQ